MTAAPKRLLRRSPLLPNESLHSFLERLAILNHVRSSLDILSLVGQGQILYENATIFTSWDAFLRLSELSDVPPLDLYRSSVHRFSEILSFSSARCHEFSLPEGIPLPIQEKDRQGSRLLSAGSARFCPQCVTEGSYHRIEWFLVSLSACHVHKTLFANRCGKCGSRISIRSIVRNRCQACGQFLSGTKTADLSLDQSGISAQDILRSWFGLSSPQDLTIPTHLPRQHPGALYQFSDRVRRSMLLGDRKWIESVVLIPHGIKPGWVWQEISEGKVYSPAVSYVMWCASIRILLKWPHNFHAYLEKLPLRKGSSHPTGVIFKDFGVLFSNRLESEWRKPEFRFIQDAFSCFLIDHYGLTTSVLKTGRFRRDKFFFKKHPAITASLAARILGVTGNIISRLVRTGELERYCPNPHIYARSSPYIVKRSVLALRRKWGGVANLKQTALLLGTSEDITLDLIKRNILCPIAGPGKDRNGIWIIEKLSIRQFLLAMQEHVIVRKISVHDAYRLNEVARMTSAIAVNAAELLIRLSHGEINGFSDSKATFRVDSLWFSVNEIRAFTNHFFEKKGWIRRQAIAKDIGVKESVLKRWVSSGLLVPVATVNHIQYFDKEAVEIFVRDLIFSDEVSEILEVGTLTVQKWARCGRLKTVAGPEINGCHRYLFHREDVMRLRPENRLTAPQLARKLELSRSQLGEWIRKGKVKPISGPGVDQSGHYLFLSSANKENAAD